jgi:hypothetical protein
MSIIRLIPVFCDFPGPGFVCIIEGKLGAFLWENIMKKLLIIIAALLVMTGCGRPHEYTLTEEEYERLITLDGPMFSYGRYSNGLVSGRDDYWEGSGFTVYYDGTIEGFTSYNLSGEFTSTAPLEKEDYFTIYEFCRNWMLSDMNGVYDYGGCEQDSYSFNFYDEDGERNSLYYTDNIDDDKLKEIVDIYGKYDIKIEVIPVFNVFQYLADPGTPDLFVAEYNEAKITGYKYECRYDGTMLFGGENCEDLDWYVYIRSGDSAESKESFILQTLPETSLEEYEVKRGDVIFVYPEYHGEGVPPETHMWGYYSRLY